MGISDKSKHVGNHGGGYRDLDGMHRQFTYIDHDPKIKMSASNPTPEEKEAIKSSLISYREGIIQRILDVPASLCPEPFYDFTIRGENTSVVKWNDTMLKDPGMEISRLVTLCNILENRFSSNSI